MEPASDPPRGVCTGRCAERDGLGVSLLGAAHGDKQEEILRAASQLFEQKGYAATSVQDIADRVGLQKASLYYYVDSKEEILFRIAREAINAFNDELERIVNMGQSPSETLRRAIAAHLEAVANNREVMTVFLRESYALPAEKQEIIHKESDRYTRLMQDIVVRGMAAGEFRPVDTTMVVMAILGACNWFYRWYDPQGRLSPQGIAAIFADLILTGLQKPA